MTVSVRDQPVRRKHRQRGHRVGLPAFVVLALAAAGAGFVVRAGAEPPPSATATGAAFTPAAYVLSAEASAEVRAARFRISTTRTPTSAVLTLDPPGTSPARTVPVELPSTSTEVVVRGLAVGRTTWTIAAKGAPVVRGTLRIPATSHHPQAPVDPASATLVPGSAPSAAPGPSTSTSGGTSSGGTSPKPTPAPSTRPTATSSPTVTPWPTPRPTPTPTSTPLPAPTMRVSTGASKILTGSPTRPQLVITGLPAGYRGTATLRLYGPAPQQSEITCQTSTLFHTQTITVTANGTYVGYHVRLDRAGYYGWSVALPGSAASAPVASGCAPAGAVVQASQW